MWPQALKSIWSLVKQTTSEWIDQEVSRHGAALAFYTLFAIAPLFVIMLAIVGLWFGEEAARRELFGQVSGLVGSGGGRAIQALVSAQILFFGAKFTQIYSNRHGSQLEPSPGAKAVTLTEVAAESPHPRT